MATPLYFEDSKYYVNKEVFAPGICSLLFNSDSSKAEIRIAKTRHEVVDMQLIGAYTTKTGTPYTTVDDIFTAVPDFFSNKIINNDVQYPLSVDGDSVHAKDIDINRSDLGDFKGKATDFFDNLHSENVDPSANNPKTLLIHFNRTLVTPLIGLGSSEGGSFSNTKVIAIVSGGVEITLDDHSTDNTNRTSQFFTFPNAGLNALKLEFHTTDDIALTNIFIPKITTVAAIPETPVKYASSYRAPFLLNGASDAMNVDGSGTPVDFVYTVSGLTRAKWERSFIELTDGVQNFTSSNFGAIANGLANGVQIIVVKDGVETVLETWKTNMDISLTMFDFNSPYRQGEYVGRWTLSKDIGSPVSLYGGDQIIFRVRDDLEDLDSFRAKIKLGQ